MTTIRATAEAATRRATACCDAATWKEFRTNALDEQAQKRLCSQLRGLGSGRSLSNGELAQLPELSNKTIFIQQNRDQNQVSPSNPFEAAGYGMLYTMTTKSNAWAKSCSVLVRALLLVVAT